MMEKRKGTTLMTLVTVFRRFVLWKMTNVKIERRRKGKA
jgi:hypothetical protein